MPRVKRAITNTNHLIRAREMSEDASIMAELSHKLVICGANTWCSL